MTDVMEGRFLSRSHVERLLLAALFLLPLSPTLLYVPLCGAVLLFLLRQIKLSFAEVKIPPLAPFGLGFILWALVSCAASPDKLFALFNWAFLPLQYGLLYVLVYSVMDTEESRRRALLAFFAGALCVVVYGLFQYANAADMAQDLTEQSWVDPKRFPLLRRRMYSTLENPNLFGGYLLMGISYAVSFFLFLKGKKKYIAGVCVLAFLLCLALTYSRGAWVSLAAIVAGLAIFYDKRFGLLFLLVPVIIFAYHGQITERFLSLFSGEDTSLALRLALWESSRAMVEEHPLLGVGWGSYFLAYPDYNFFIQDAQVLIFHAHNLFLDIPAETGLPGGILYFVFFFGQAYFSWKLYKRSSGDTKALSLAGLLMVIAIAASGMADHVLFARSVSFCFWSLCALSLSGTHQKNE